MMPVSTEAPPYILFAMGSKLESLRMSITFKQNE